MKHIFALLISLVLPVSCAVAQGSGSHAAEEAAIRQLLATTDAASAAGDYDTFIKMYADDAVLMMPGNPMVLGSKKIKEVTQAAFGDPSVSVEIKLDHVDVAASGELGYAYGTGVMHFDDPSTGQRMMQKSKWVTVFEKQANGAWQAVADIFNNDGPPEPAE